MQKSEFQKYATKHLGMNSLALEQYMAQNSYISPSILEERQLNVTQMDVFSRLMMDRIIFLGTPIDDYVANVIQAQLLFLDTSDPGKDISIYLNSPGGSVHAGLGIYDTMQYIGSDVATICTGMAASMAAVLLVAGEKGKRSALKHSRVMIHQPMGGMQGQASDMEINYKQIMLLRDELYQIISDHSGQSFEKIMKDSDRDYWMTALEAKEYILTNFSVDYKDYDAIIGYRADDSYFSFAQDFINGTISYRQLNNAMHLGKLGQQFVLKSKKAFERIKYVGYEVAESDEWYSKKMLRDKTARREYFSVERNKRQRGDLYIVQIMDEEMKPNDPRLR